ncbi:hypothetical protein CcaCcLH18_13539 [Colletotrichum camelliae]|nr:hypothetical protein CcaCcLH18_13539 [Colletotrichum camelliae]
MASSRDHHASAEHSQTNSVQSSFQALKKPTPTKSVPVGSFKSFIPRDESPDPLSLPSITEFQPSTKSFITDEPRADPSDHDDSDSNVSMNYTQIYAISVSSDDGDSAWVPRTTHKRSPDPPKRPVRPFTRKPFDPFIPIKTRKPAWKRSRRSNKTTAPSLVRASSTISLSTVVSPSVQPSASALNILTAQAWRPAGPVISQCVSIDLEKLDDGTRNSLRQCHLQSMERVASWVDVTEHERIKDLEEKRAQEEFQGEKLLWFD